MMYTETVKRFTHINEQPFADLNTTNIDGKRFYQTPNGNYPSVTTVTGFKKSQFFAEWRRKNPKEAVRVTNRGNKLHSLIEDYLNNEFDPQTDKNRVTPDTLELFLQIQPELNKIDNIHAQEVALFSDTLQLAGRVDCVGEYNGKLSIIDFKGSTRSKNREDIQNYFQQATAYAIMWQEMTGVVIENFAILVSCEDGEVQVFEGHPLQHVRALKEAIDYYQARL